MVRLPDAEKFDPERNHEHMAGLVLGNHVKKGASILISKGSDKYINLIATEFGDELNTFKFTEQNNDNSLTPGDLLVLRQYQVTHVTVKNLMSDLTFVHWRGLEWEFHQNCR